MDRVGDYFGKLIRELGEATVDEFKQTGEYKAFSKARNVCSALGDTEKTTTQRLGDIYRAIYGEPESDSKQAYSDREIAEYDAKLKKDYREICEIVGEDPEDYELVIEDSNAEGKGGLFTKTPGEKGVITLYRYADDGTFKDMLANNATTWHEIVHAMRDREGRDSEDYVTEEAGTICETLDRLSKAMEKGEYRVAKDVYDETIATAASYKGAEGLKSEIYEKMMNEPISALIEKRNAAHAASC